MNQVNDATENKRRAALLALGFGLAVFLVVALIFSALAGPTAGLVLGLLVAGGWVAYGWFMGDGVVLDLTDVDPVEDEEARPLNAVDAQCVVMGVSVPVLYITDDPGLNAMAVGRDSRHSSLVFTRGLVDELTVIELQAVVALLLHRVKSSAIGPETFVVPTFGGSLVLSEMSDKFEWLSRALAAPMPLFEKVMGAIHSGRGQIDDDIAAVGATRYPPALASALEKMDGRSALTVAAPVTAHLWIAPPMGVNARPGIARAHVPLNERISVLHEL